MRQIGVIEDIYTEDQRGFTINLRIKLADGFAVFGNRKMLDGQFDMGAWWLYRLSNVFQSENVFSIIGKPCLVEVEGRSVKTIASVDGKRCFDPCEEVKRRFGVV